MTIDQAAVQPASRSVMWGMGIDLCVTLSDCRPPGEWLYVFVFSCLCCCLHVCVCAVHVGLIGLSIRACPGNQ